MNKVFTPSLLVLGLFLAGCGKNDNNNTTTPVVPPVVVNPVVPVNPWQGSTPINVNSLRSIFSTVDLASGVSIGDSFDRANSWGFSLNFIFFGQRFGTGSNADRYTVSGVSNAMIDVTNNGSLETIDRPYLMNLIFSDHETDVYSAVRRGCIQIDVGDGGVRVINGAIIDKYWSPGYGQAQGQPYESVVVATAGLPLYINPIMVTSYNNPTKYVKRFKVGAEVINILGAGPCQ